MSDDRKSEPAVLILHRSADAEAAGSVAAGLNAVGAVARCRSIADATPEILRDEIADLPKDRGVVADLDYAGWNLRVGEKFLAELAAPPYIAIERGDPAALIDETKDYWEASRRLGRHVGRMVRGRNEAALHDWWEAESKPSGIWSTDFAHREEAIAADFDAFARRKNAIFAAAPLEIGGITLESAWNSVKQFPVLLRDAAVDIIDREISDPASASGTFDAPAWRAALGVADVEVRVRATRIVGLVIALWRREQALQELIPFPIVLNSAYVPPRFEVLSSITAAPLDGEALRDAFLSCRYTLAVSGLSKDAPARFLGDAIDRGGVVVADPSPAIDAYLRPSVDYCPISLGRGLAQDELARLIDDPTRAYAMTRAAAERWRAAPRHAEGARDFLRLAETLRASRPATIGP